MGDSPQGDANYGRLFTLHDVRLLMHLTAKQTTEQLGKVIHGGRFDGPTTGEEAIAVLKELLADTTAEGRLTFPVDEPLFLLRASDPASIPALRGYAIGCGEAGIPFGRAIEDLLPAFGKMADWQRENPDRIHIPPLTEEQP